MRHAGFKLSLAPARQLVVASRPAGRAQLLLGARACHRRLVGLDVCLRVSAWWARK